MKRATALLLNVAMVGIMAASTPPAFGTQIQVDEKGNIKIDGTPGPPGTVGTDPISGAQALIYSLPFAGNAGDVLLSDPTSGHPLSDIIRFPGNGTMEIFSLIAKQTTLSAAATAGATNIKVASVTGYAAGQKIDIGASASAEAATIVSVGTAGAAGTGITLTAPLAAAHPSGDAVSEPLKLADVLALPTPITPSLSLDEVGGIGAIWTPGTAGIGGDPNSSSVAYAFETNFVSNSVPAPGSILLVVLGLGMLVARRHRGSRR